MAEAPVAREVTQAKMDLLAAATLRHTPSQPYTVADRFEEKARTHPDRPFIHYEGRTWNYRSINAAANRVAHVVRQHGLVRGQVAALLMENRPEFIVTWLGLAKVGVTVALINTQLRGDVLRNALDTTGAAMFVVGSEILASVVAIAQERPLTGFVYADPAAASTPTDGAGLVALDARLASAPDDDLDPEVRAGLTGGDDLFHIFTSGTTGLPKAARLSHMRYLGVGDGMSAIAGYGPDDVIACVLPLYHGAGGMVVVSCALSQGAAIALRRRFSTSRFWEDARRDGVTACQYVGELCRYLLNAPPSPADRDHSIRVLMGAGLGTDMWRPFQERFGIERILEGWSSTEANTSLINLDGRVGSCGRIPFKERHNGRLIRYDVATDRHPRTSEGRCIECAPGEVGEFIGMILDLPDSGAGRFEGYTSAAATERKILRDVFQPGDRWYRSGDLLSHDADDYFTFVDRIGDTYRWKSENVSTQEVAETLASFPGVAIANVYGVAVPGAEGRAGMAALVLHPGIDFDCAGFFGFTARALPSYALPLFVRLTPEADVTSTFKLRKVELQAEGWDPELIRDPLFFRDERAGTYHALTPAVHASVPARLGLVARTPDGAP
ncbi:MAG: long-chain-acyl-CoA synthetase [Candidatus Binatia bacterium]